MVETRPNTPMRGTSAPASSGYSTTRLSGSVTTAVPSLVPLAMGAAIECFEGAQAIEVPRSRFAPVKTTADLLVVRSDAYQLADDGRVVLAAECGGCPPVVELDPRYRLVEDLDRLIADNEKRRA